jgi:hypothetical protein
MSSAALHASLLGSLPGSDLRLYLVEHLQLAIHDTRGSAEFSSVSASEVIAGQDEHSNSGQEDSVNLPASTLSVSK